jgi:SHS2 domain-containing protein
MTFKFIENVSVADVAFEAAGKNLNQLFESCGLATTQTMIKDLKKIALKKSVNIKLKNDNLEQLLNDFMNEIIYIKDAKLLLFRNYKVNIRQKDDRYLLEAKFTGDKINMKKQELLVDVKAATWHMFKVEKTTKGWKAFVILDV